MALFLKILIFIFWCMAVGVELTSLLKYLNHPFNNIAWLGATLIVGATVFIAFKGDSSSLPPSRKF